MWSRGCDVGALNLSGGLKREPLSILAEGFPVMLSAFNELVRELRGAGIEVREQLLLDNQVEIEAVSADLFVERFGDRFRGVRYSSAGRFTRNSVNVRGVDVVWLSSIREQQ